MKKRIVLLMGLALLLSFAACGSNPSSDADSSQGNTDSSRENVDSSQGNTDSSQGNVDGVQTNESEPVTENASSQASEEGERISDTEEGADSPEAENGEAEKLLIAYFSVPEDVDTSGVDAIAGASIVVREDEILGNTEYVANIIQQTIGGDLFRIETTQQYPLDHDPLVDQAAEEQDADARPELAAHIENLDQYDTLILGFPNWWGDLPQPLYTFLEEYDLSGKTIIPFVTHGGSGFSDTRRTIASLQPNAAVSDNALSLSRNSVADSRDDVVSWAESLGVN